jgi:uncharacterized protein (TIGR02266 family)
MGSHVSSVARPGRIDLRVPVVIGVGGERVNAETRNIGLGGVFFATRAPPPVGQRISLNLTLPQRDEPLAVDGEVRWVRLGDDGGLRDGVPGVGVKFVRPPLYVAAALDNFVRSHAPAR